MGKKRVVGPEGAGSGGDLNDRFRGAYSPGNHPDANVTPGLENPVKVIKRLFKKKPKPAPVNPSGWTGPD